MMAFLWLGQPALSISLDKKITQIYTDIHCLLEVGSYPYSGVDLTHGPARHTYIYTYTNIILFQIYKYHNGASISGKKKYINNIHNLNYKN